MQRTMKVKLAPSVRYSWYHLLFRAEWASTYLRRFLPNNKNAFARFDVQVLVHNFAKDDFLIACARVDFDVEVA